MSGFILCLSFFLLFGIVIFAHPGNTDGSGGHSDNSSGEYHYHHGYPAHQHTGGECPYDFDDRTGYNSGSSSSSNNAVTQSALEKELSKIEENKKSDIFEIIEKFKHEKYSSIAAFSAVAFVFLYGFGYYYENEVF